MFIYRTISILWSIHSRYIMIGVSIGIYWKVGVGGAERRPPLATVPHGFHPQRNPFVSCGQFAVPGHNGSPASAPGSGLRKSQQLLGSEIPRLMRLVLVSVAYIQSYLFPLILKGDK